MTEDHEKVVLRKLRRSRLALCAVLWGAVLLPVPAALVSLSWVLLASGFMLATAALLWWYRSRLLPYITDDTDTDTP